MPSFGHYFVVLSNIYIYGERERGERENYQYYVVITFVLKVITAITTFVILY